MMQVKVTSTTGASAGSTQAGGAARPGDAATALSGNDTGDGRADGSSAGDTVPGPQSASTSGRSSSRSDRTGPHGSEHRASGGSPDASSQAGLPASASTLESSSSSPGQAVAPADNNPGGEAGPTALPPAPDAPSTTGSQASPSSMPFPAAQADGEAPVQAGASLLTSSSALEGSNRLAISLHPKDLGAVQVQLDRGADGSVRVVVAAAEPATLRSLMTNQDQLHAALDAAAIPAGDRHLSFELTAPTAATGIHHPAEGGAATTPRSDTQTMPDLSGFRNSERQEMGQSQGDRTGGFAGRSRNRSGSARTSEGGAVVPVSSVASTRRVPSGSINITA